MIDFDQNHSRLLEAVDCVIRDVDKKYDECLVDHFMEFLSTNLSADQDTSQEQSLLVLDRLKSYFDHKAFVMMNQTRAYKTLHAVIKGKRFSEPQHFNQFLPYLDSFWYTVDSIIINENLSAVTILLSIISELCHSKPAFIWICKRASFEPELKIQKGSQCYRIVNIVSFIEYYLSNCNNYHTQNKTEYLLRSLIERHLLDNCDEPGTEVFQEEVKNMIASSIHKKSLSVLIIINQILERNSGNEEFLESLERYYNIYESLHGLLTETLNSTRSNSNDLCRTLAILDSLHKNRQSIDIFGLLVSKKKLDSAVVYLTNLKENSDEHRSRQLYNLLYCISRASGKTSESIDPRIERLNNGALSIKTVMNSESIPDKLTTTCIMNMSRILPSFTDRNDQLFLIKDVLIDYITSQYRYPRNFKNVMESCNILKLCSQSLNCDIENEASNGYLDRILDTILTIDSSIDRSKLVLMNLLGSLKFKHKNRTQLARLLDVIASLSDNHDILNEFMEVIMHSDIDFTASELGQEPLVERYIDFLWNSVHKNAQDTEHLDLLGNLYKVLAKLDQEVDRDILRKFDIEKGSTIRILLNEYKIPHPDEYAEMLASENNRMINSTIVDDIINYELISDGIIDCY